MATLATLTRTGLEKPVASAPGHRSTVTQLVFDSLTDAQLTALEEALKPVIESLAIPGIPGISRIL